MNIARQICSASSRRSRRSPAAGKSTPRRDVLVLVPRRADAEDRPPAGDDVEGRDHASRGSPGCGTSRPSRACRAARWLVRAASRPSSVYASSMGWSSPPSGRQLLEVVHHPEREKPLSSPATAISTMWSNSAVSATADEREVRELEAEGRRHAARLPTEAVLEEGRHGLRHDRVGRRPDEPVHVAVAVAGRVDDLDVDVRRRARRRRTPRAVRRATARPAARGAWAGCPCPPRRVGAVTPRAGSRGPSRRSPRTAGHRGCRPRSGPRRRSPRCRRGTSTGSGRARGPRPRGSARRS